MKSKIFAASAAVLISAIPSFAIVGAGFHWGFDFSTSMTDTPRENVLTAGDIGLDSISQGGVSVATGFGDSAFAYVSRTGFERTPINFGGKFYVDALPVEFEASVNMGVWQYDGQLSYISSVDTTGGAIKPQYTTEAITIEKIGGVSFFGVDKTPYGKFQTDLTLKHTFKKIPVFKPSLGAGASLHFATPVLSEQLVKDALSIGSDLSAITPESLDLNNPETMKAILSEITDGAKKPKMGMHFLVGFQIRPPVIPLGLYVDGKYLLTFTDKDSGVGVETQGFLINGGILIAIGK